MKRQNAYLKRRIETEKAQRGNRCAFCLGTTQLQFAHIKPTGLNGRGRGRADRYYDILKNPDCYVLACHSCHTKLDAGLLETAP